MTNSLAPYPTNAADVTADGLAKHLAVSAQRRWLANMNAPGLDRNALNLFVKEWGVIYLLREIEERAGVKTADDVALELWEAWGDGSHLGEMLWEWLTEYGIDPEAVA